MLTIDRLIALKDVIKWNQVFREAGLNSSTMRSAMHYRRELRGSEVLALTDALARRGLHVLDGQQYDLFASGSGQEGSSDSDGAEHKSSHAD